MGKIKSAIITALLVAAILVLALFATISIPELPGSNGVVRYNSFISGGIHLGSDFTGEAYAMLYPEGVITSADYYLVVNDDEAENKQEYIDKYTSRGGYFVDNEKLEDEKAFKESILKDAEIISDRLSQKGYSSYSVTVVDGYAIKMSVPTNFTYAAYKSYDNVKRSEELTKISTTMTVVKLSGKLGLRDGADFKTSKSLVSINDDFGSFFKGASMGGVAGTYFFNIDLTDEGYESLNEILLSQDSGNAYIYIGETSLSSAINFPTLSLGSPLSGKILQYSSSENFAQDASIIFSSVIAGNVLTNKYNNDDVNTTTQIVTENSEFGDMAAVYLAVAVLLVIVAAIVCSVIKYKLLGLVNALMILIYALSLITSIMLLNIQLTIAGAFTAISGLALLCFTNFYVFETVRRETQAGRTVQASVKLGYKKTLAGVLDLHILLVLASLILSLVGVGELAACGLIFFIGSLASYILYWFTRFMWYVISSPVKDKFKFGGFAREEDDDED